MYTRVGFPWEPKPILLSGETLATVHTELNLTEISNEEFDEMVNQDVRGTLDSSRSEALRQPENIERWYNMLLTTKRRVEVQLTANRAGQAEKQAEFLNRGEEGKILWLRYRAQNETWRKQAIWFKNGVEDRISEVKLLRSDVRSDRYTTHVAAERDTALEQVIELRTAIRRHQLATVEEKGDQEEIDYDLWHHVG